MTEPAEIVVYVLSALTVGLAVVAVGMTVRNIRRANATLRRLNEQTSERARRRG